MKDVLSKEEYILNTFRESKAKVNNVIIKELNSNHNVGNTDEREHKYLLQLVDLWLGSTYNAIHQVTTMKGKFQVSQIAASIFNNSKKYRSHLFKKCSYSWFPNDNNLFQEIKKTMILPHDYDPPYANKSLKNFFTQA